MRNTIAVLGDIGSFICLLLILQIGIQGTWYIYS